MCTSHIHLNIQCSTVTLIDTAIIVLVVVYIKILQYRVFSLGGLKGVGGLSPEEMLPSFKDKNMQIHFILDFRYFLYKQL